MDDDLLNILSNSNKDIDNQKLMDYLSDKLPDNEKHEFEKHLVDSDMLNDAIEGLGKFKDKKNVAAFVAQLNANLKKQLAKPKEKRMKRTINDLPWLYLTIIIILLLILVGFIIIKEHLLR